MSRSPKDSSAPWKIVPQGDRGALLIFGDEINIKIGQQCTRAAAALRAANIKGISDIVPTFNSVALHYQPMLLGASTGFRQLAGEIDNVLANAFDQDAPPAPSRQIDIPVCYGGAYGPDLASVAEHCRLSQDEVIELHSHNPAYVFMLGFAPGAPYIGMHDEKLAIGRRSTPRTDVPAGSVAIANLQTMIYPNTSPGGWHIIGATPLVLFDPFQEPPTLLSPDDTVRFVPISADQFVALRGQRT
ncbi:5-oxoprolinase subunit PxpB [Candidimonas sp. SYP-B2681]|uniref:5-oxoprolinase subunit PxpB n=1 Tax=Candidimonas sp. SYP-B2681 TaxID=2497686 RepID=UPI000F85ED1D|nr:5-oxoprolinase subunit PxpB [Candidimonas sp. SYP-B2681]RTZ39769.1 5-oxoprolinase subunit PxpB [Candidimonas sp. SYP-B2681]